MTPRKFNKKKKNLFTRYLPELVYITGMEDTEKADRNLMTDISNYTRLSPKDRLTKIKAMKEKF